VGIVRSLDMDYAWRTLSSEKISIGQAREYFADESPFRMTLSAQAREQIADESGPSRQRINLLYVNLSAADAAIISS
jgi:hypothetical protein